MNKETSMMSASHTPGPWEQNAPTEYSHDGAALCLIEVGDRVSIELTGSITNKTTVEEVQTVANLIKAAPELLEAALKAEALLTELSGSGVYLKPGAHRDLRDAIAKARGGVQ